jgi:hypothetical protein
MTTGRYGVSQASGDRRGRRRLKEMENLATEFANCAWGALATWQDKLPAARQIR